jgi:hypothetical protein
VKRTPRRPGASSRSRGTRGAVVLCTLLACVPCIRAADGASAPASAASADEGLGAPSEAERLLFMAPALSGVHEPRTLSYDYVADEAGRHLSDRVSLTLTKQVSGRCCTSHVDYRSGPAAIALPDLDEPQGNPVLMYFLEDQVRSLEHATKGQSSHFRRRIRQALAAEAQVKDTSVRWEGKDVPAREIRIAPFLNDPYRPRFEREAHTEFDFVLSDAVPGGLVRLSSTLPADKPGDPPQAQRTLSIVDPQPAPPARK